MMISRGLRVFVAVGRPRLIVGARRWWHQQPSLAQEQEAAWDRARALLEEGDGEEAHEVAAEAIEAHLQAGALAGAPGWPLPLLTLELGKSFLRRRQAQDAMDSFEHSTRLFQAALEASAPNPPPSVSSRYVESLLHLAKLLSLSGQGNPEHLWKTAISHAMKHLGREAYEILVASLGLAEYYLELLRLADADRYSSAAVELARSLPWTRQVGERLVEGLSMQGIAMVQRQNLDEGIRFYELALEELNKIEAAQAGGELDNWTKAALHNLYRNMEHAYSNKDDAETAKAWKDRRDAKLMKAIDVVLEEPSSLKERF